MNGHHSAALQFSSKIPCTGWCFVVSNIGIVTDCKLFSLLSAVMPSLRGEDRDSGQENDQEEFIQNLPRPTCHFALS